MKENPDLFLQILLVAGAVTAFLTISALIAALVLIGEARGGLRQLKRGPEVPRDGSGRRLYERL